MYYNLLVNQRYYVFENTRLLNVTVIGPFYKWLLVATVVYSSQRDDYGDYGVLAWITVAEPFS
jgi:hypothetical protein